MLSQGEHFPRRPMWGGEWNEGESPVISGERTYQAEGKASAKNSKEFGVVWAEQVGKSWKKWGGSQGPDELGPCRHRRTSVLL